jgi:hypothetical protein
MESPSPFPFDVARNLGVFQQLLFGVEVLTQFLLLGDQVMNCLMAGLADLDSFPHLFPRVSLLEPLVAVQGSRDKMVEVVSIFGFAEFAKHDRRPKPVMKSLLPHRLAAARVNSDVRQDREDQQDQVSTLNLPSVVEVDVRAALRLLLSKEWWLLARRPGSRARRSRSALAAEDTRRNPAVAVSS